jgi:hypothetical protein
MTKEIGVYASFVKDLIFGLSSLVLFWVVRYPQWLYFSGHSLTWIVFFLYYSSDPSVDNIWSPTFALLISVAVCLLDAWICLTLVCFLGDYCCIGTADDAPFSFEMQVCGKNERYQTDSFVYIALTTVGLGILTGLSRISSIYDTRKGASMFMVAACTYILLKLYVLVWRSVEYSPFFITMAVFTMGAVFAGACVAIKYRFVATCLFFSVMIIDLSVVLGATDAVKFLSNYSLETQSITGGGRRLLMTEEPTLTLAVTAFESFPTGYARQALANSVATLAAYTVNPAIFTADAATNVVQDAKALFASFASGLHNSVNQLLGSTDATSVDVKTKALALMTRADAFAYVVQETHCCDPNTRFDVTIERLHAQVAEYEAAFDAEFRAKVGSMKASVSSIESNLADTPEVSDAEVASWLKAVQQFLVRVWKKVVGKANSINVDPNDLPLADQAKAAADFELPPIGAPPFPPFPSIRAPLVIKSSPWLNVPKFIKYVWTGLHCLCAIFNFVCIISLWSRDLTWALLFGAHHRTFREETYQEHDTAVPIAATSRYAGAHLNKRTPKHGGGNIAV